jgi:hypothetical protein
LRCLAEAGDVGGIELLPWDEEVGPHVQVAALWLAWNDGCVGQDRACNRRRASLRPLADPGRRLEEAGCTNADLLAHCRRPGEHLRTCWVVDSLLGDEERR